jgi:hypothetical protein
MGPQLVAGWSEVQRDPELQLAFEVGSTLTGLRPQAVGPDTISWQTVAVNWSKGCTAGATKWITCLVVGRNCTFLDHRSNLSCEHRVAGTESE